MPECFVGVQTATSDQLAHESIAGGRGEVALEEGGNERGREKGREEGRK